MMKQQMGIRTYADLSAEEREQVDNKVKRLNVHDTVDIINFGTEDAADLSAFSSKMLKNFSAQAFTDFNQIIVSLMDQVKAVNPGALMEVYRNQYVKIPFLGKRYEKGIVEKVNGELKRYTNIQNFIDDVSLSLERIKMQMLQDLKRSAQMRTICYEYADALELNSIVLEIKKVEVQTQIEQLQKRYQVSNLRESTELDDLKNILTTLERKQVATQTYRIISLQNLPKLTFISNASEAIVNKIEDVVVNVMPQWEQQFCFAIFAYDIKNATFVLENVRHLTEAMYRKNGIMLKNATEYTASEIEKLPVSMEVLEDVNKQLLKTCDNLIQVGDEAKQTRNDILPQLSRLQEEISSNRLS